MNINNRLKKLREHLGLNQTQMSVILGIEQSTYSKYEKEGSRIPDYAIIILCSKYSLNESWLRNNEGEMFLSEGYKVLDPEQTISEPLLTINMQTEIEFLRAQVAELNATVRDQAASLRDYAAAEKDNAKSRVNLTDTVIAQAQAIVHLSSGKALKKASGGI